MDGESKLEAPPNPERAHRLLRVALGAYLTGVAIASPWDIYWHTQRSFESFLTPPHLLLYSSMAFGGATVAGIAFNPSLRAAFGEPLPRSPRWLAYPPPLILLGAGFVVMVIAGGLDDFWHSTWGQNETRWSYPHGLLAFGVWLIALGLASCRMALAKERPFTRATPVVYGVLVLAFSLSAMIGPMAFNISPDVNARVAAMPGFWGPDTQGLMDLIARWTLDRSNLLFPALAAAWAVLGVAVLEVIERRATTLAITGAVATGLLALVGLAWAYHTDLLGTPNAWIPLPILGTVLVWLATRGRAGAPHLQWIAAGLATGLLTAAIYRPTPEGFAFALLAAPAGWAAGFLGTRLGAQLEDPTPRGVRVVLAMMCAVLPAALGSVDLALRFA